MSLAGYFRIIRPFNSVVAGLAAAVAYLIATGSLVPGVLLPAAVVFLVTAAGNVINDYFDSEIDAVNRPGRPIPSGLVMRVSARSFASTLFLAGIMVSLFTGPLCMGIAIFNSALLVIYAARLKGMPLAGNIAVSYLSASLFLFGGAFAGWDGLFHGLPVAMITFLAMLARELLKDAEDVKGDLAGGADTLPIRIGIPKTAGCAFACAVFAIAASILPYSWWGILYLAGILPVDIVILISAVRSLGCDTPECIVTRQSTTWLKYGMFASLIVFVLSALLL